MFSGNNRLVGGLGTTYSSSNTNEKYARIDRRPSAPGYFTLKSSGGDQTPTGDLIGTLVYSDSDTVNYGSGSGYVALTRHFKVIGDNITNIMKFMLNLFL